MTPIQSIVTGEHSAPLPVIFEGRFFGINTIEANVIPGPPSAVQITTANDHDLDYGKEHQQKRRMAPLA